MLYVNFIYILKNMTHERCFIYCSSMYRMTFCALVWFIAKREGPDEP